MKSIFLLAFAILFNCMTVESQNDPSEKLGGWYIVASNSKISNRLSVQLQAQFRFYEFTSEIQQMKIRSGLRYRILPGLSVAAGYAYFRNDFSYLSDIPPAFNEHRIVEEILFNHDLSKIKVNHRARVENRFIIQNGDTTTRHWFNYTGKLVLPINEFWSVDIYDQIFLNFDNPTFAQNWLGTGISYKFNELVKTRVGYQKIMMDGPNFDRVLFEIIFTPDFSTKEKD